jgi:hypothetical protein
MDEERQHRSEVLLLDGPSTVAGGSGRALESHLRVTSVWGARAAERGCDVGSGSPGAMLSEGR